jgi:uncharacterized heparinase superfamily protein
VKIARLIHTISPLRWRQIAYRPWRIVQKRLYRRFPRLTTKWVIDSVSSPAVPEKSRLAFRNLLLQDLLHLTPSPESIKVTVQELCEGKFSFLNQTIQLGIPDWNKRHGSHLWNFQLHYFTFTVACARQYLETRSTEDFGPCRRLIESWITTAKPGASDGWDAYPVSLRVVNWIYGHALISAHYPDQEFLDRWSSSIWRQLDFLSSHLEYHLLANHLFKNIKALVIGGLYFNNPVWLAKGERLLWREVDEQVLPDGGHFERAPMYHAQTLADLIECVTMLRHFNRPVPKGADNIDARIEKMADFLEALSYRDNRLALFNDSANSPETRPGPIIKSARHATNAASRPIPTDFPSTGYYIWASSDGEEKIIVDAGPPSIDYNTAHAHCDLLSFELQLGGRPWIVDTGVHGYGGDPYRQYCRSTRAHNTVMVDGHEQSEIWSTFRLGRAARLIGASTHHQNDCWEFRGRASHYARPRRLHERRIERDQNGAWTIEDRISGGTFRFAESFLHLHPDVDVSPLSDGSYLLRNGDRVCNLSPIGTIDLELVEAGNSGPDGWYFPEFGLAEPGRMFVGRFTGQPGAPFGFRIIPTEQLFPVHAPRSL